MLSRLWGVRRSNPAQIGFFYRLFSGNVIDADKMLYSRHVSFRGGNGEIISLDAVYHFYVGSPFIDDIRMTWDNEERNRYVQAVLEQLKLKNFIIMGHSRGGENALQIAAMDNNTDEITAVILVNSPGLRIHRDDFLIETDISKEYAKALDNVVELECMTKTDVDNTRITQQTIAQFAKGHQRLAVCFSQEGHYLQKFRAKYLADVIDSLIEKR
uniref:Alpha/beta hydrolase n=1 Tax=Heterorhabditis bacteriophora TaxID=37862 RepID=A0A1I7XIM8_HETBA